MREYFTDPITGEAMYRDDREPIKELSQKDTDTIAEILERSKDFYPEQYEALGKVYAKSSVNKPLYDFLMARRIINCCFGENDRMPDVDEFGNYNFEMVHCPLIAECKYFKIICQPTYKSDLTERELEVMKMYFNNVSTDDIAERLFISIHTVNNHRRNALHISKKLCGRY